MIVTMIPYCPATRGKDLGFAYNELIGRLRNDDWACFLDHDACFTTPDWYAQLEEITAGLSGLCVLTAVTNRVGSHWQLAPGVDRNDHAMDYHRRVGRDRQAAARCVVCDVTAASPLSGVVLLLSKATWRQLGGFEPGFLGVDTALHRAVQAQGGRVYLMEGVYVYHWYRADQAGATPLLRTDEPARLDTELADGIDRVRGTAHSSDSSNGVPTTDFGELDSDSWDGVRVAGRRVLAIDRDVARLGLELKRRNPSRLMAIELEAAVVDRTREQLGDIKVMGAGEDLEGLVIAAGSFDLIACNGLLESSRRPGELLTQLHRWLAPDGRLVASVANARRLGVVQGLLAGRWEGASVPGRRPCRFFTRREIEKLFHRAGFAPSTLTPFPGPEHTGWARAGRPGEVQVGGLHIGGLDPADAEEFFVDRYRIEAGPAQPVDHGLTSIVILTHDQLDYTRQCLDSIRRFTDEPYELIVVDNASFDGTLEYLRAQPDVRLIANAENRGFPAAANQGIAVAQGQQVLLLNNDTIVTTGWLGRMLRALASDSDIGLVGPCSNRVSGAQQVEARYDDVSALDGFAWDWGKAHDGIIEDSDRLIGFCLLIRRGLIDEIGVLDERFGIGCFEDDDYCRRALREGYRAVIARDAFVHHYGGRTFVGSGVDFAAVMRDNERKFRAKWDEEEKRAEEAQTAQGKDPAQKKLKPGESPYTVVMAPGGGLLLQRKKIRLSLCMIVRDSAKTLPACLESIRPWVDEMVLVDTGSKDDTIDVIKRFGGRLFHFPWCDDFSAARNVSLQHAKGEWLFWMDSDDTITPECGRKLRELAYGETDRSILGYVVQVHCPGGGEGGDLDVTAVDHVKLIRNRATLRFEGRIHEQILPAIRRERGEVAWTDLYVVHSGSDRSAEGQERKRERDLRLLALELKERPEHPFTLFNLGMTYADGGRYEEAAGYLERSIARSGEFDSHLRKAYALLAYSRMQSGRWDEGLETCRKGLSLFPEDDELRFRLGVVLHQLGRLAEAERAYLDVLEVHEPRHFTSVDRGLRGFKAYQNLAVVYGEMGDLAKAERQWRQVVREVPHYRTGWRGLGDVLLKRGKLEEVGATADLLCRDDATRVEGSLLKGRLAVARGDVATARRELEGAASAQPDDQEPWRALSQLLFDHGRPGEAERALREVVRLDPLDGSAHHNLGTTYLRTGRFREATASYRESVRCRPGSAVTHLHLGYALKEGGRIHEAVAAWLETLRLSPDDPSAEQELRWAERHGLKIEWPSRRDLQMAEAVSH
jgi:O-antigen biosynthesis protein